MPCGSASADDDKVIDPPSGMREGVTAVLLRAVCNVLWRPALSPRVSVAQQRRRLRRLTRVSPPLRRLDIEQSTCGGITGEWLRPAGANASAHSDAAILYLHGGAYCIGSPATHRAITRRLAEASGLPVFAADYRLAPEHPFPAAVDDAVAAYTALQETGPVVIAGDSAGGGMALAAALAARQKNLRPPVALVLVSPWVDLALTNLADEKTRDPLLTSSWLAACARHYLAGSDARAPLASPLFADLRGLPPTLIQYGADELLRGDATRLHEALLAAGVAVRSEAVRGRWHVFQMHAGLLPSADAAIARAARFLSRL
jgi:acetyl esterase/lipase